MVELDDLKPSFTPAVAAEFIGTFLVQFLASACAANAADNGLAAAALGTGFAFAMVMYSISHISGGHLNPAVTVGHLITGGEDLKLKEGLSYIIAQFFGAVCGAFLAKSCLPIEALVHPFVTMGSLSDKHGEQVSQCFALSRVTHDTAGLHDGIHLYISCRARLLRHCRGQESECR